MSRATRTLSPAETERRYRDLHRAIDHLRRAQVMLAYANAGASLRAVRRALASAQRTAKYAARQVTEPEPQP